MRQTPAPLFPSRRCALAALAFLALLRPATAPAADHFLTVGGGVSPDKTQVSLERNVLYVQRILGELAVPAGCQDVLFADGADAAGRDVQWVDPKADVPRVNRLLAQVFGRETGIERQYRTQQIPGVRGPSTRAELSRWFDTVGSKLPPGDRLFVYYTGHGGKGNPVRNTTIQLWNEPAMPVKEFTALLDKVPPTVGVVLVMVQCHAGGFADVIFKDGQSSGDPKRLSPADRCGFFATVHDRPAAGCTPDIDEESYQEYSTYFWAALCGHTRTGAAVTGCDRDDDGRVSFAEAHAYAQLAADTIDVPVSTSDAFLRAFSNTKGAELTAESSSFDRLVEAATPAQRAVLEGLARQFELFGPDRIKAAKKLAEKLAGERQDLERQSRAADKEAQGLAEKIRARVTGRWPELANPYHPRAGGIVRDEADAVVRAVESHESFKRFGELRERASSLTERARAADHRWAKAQRLVRVAEDVALAANLERAASGEVVERYRKLVEAEGGTVGRATP